MFDKDFYTRPNPFWIEHFKKKEQKRQQKKEKKNDARTRQERQT